MLLVSVEGSSCVAAAGFLSGKLLIIWKGGRWSEYLDRPQADFDDLLAAPSKGRFVRERLAGGDRASTPGQPATPLDTFEHDDCCTKPLVKALFTGSLASAEEWACPKCGCAWKPDPPRPPLGRHWRPHTWVARL